MWFHCNAKLCDFIAMQNVFVFLSPKNENFGVTEFGDSNTILSLFTHRSFFQISGSLHLKTWRDELRNSLTSGFKHFRSPLMSSSRMTKQFSRWISFKWSHSESKNVFDKKTWKWNQLKNYKRKNNQIKGFELNKLSSKPLKLQLIAFLREGYRRRVFHNLASQK